MSVASSTSAAGSPNVAPPDNALRWQGALGTMRRRPVLAGGILLLCSLIIGLTGYWVVYPQVATSYHLRQAHAAADDYRFPDARAHLLACLELSPRNAEARFLLARTCRRAGDLVTARKHLQEAARFDWDREDIELEYNLAEAQPGKIRLVEQKLQSFIGSGHRDEVYVLEALVHAYVDGNFLDDAHIWVHYWIEHYPDMWWPHYLRGLILERGLKPQRAQEQYEALLEWKPDQWESRLRLGQIYLRSKAYEQARYQFERCLRARPADPEATVGLARCKRYLQESDAALALLDQLLAQKPNVATAHLHRGLILLNDLNRPADALVALRRADQLLPNDIETVGNLALAYRQLGRLEEAEVYEEKSRTLERVYRRIDTLVKEIILTDQQKRRSPEARKRNVELRYEAGRSLLEAGREQDGGAWLLSALQEDPRHAPSLELLRKYIPELTGVGSGAATSGGGK